MKIHGIIRNRRSVRSYTDEPIEEEKLKKLVEAAIWAPSAGNRYKWSIIVVQGKQEIEKIKALSPGMIFSPTAVLILCAERMKAHDKLIGGERRYVLSHLDTRTLMDISIAAQNICLEAAELGLGACMVGSFNQSALKEFLDLYGDLDAELMVGVGHPEKIPKAPKRRTVEEAIIRWIKPGGSNEE